MKNKRTKRGGKGLATKAKQRQWRESPPVVGIPAASRRFTKKSPSRRGADELLEEVQEWHQSVTQFGDLIDIFEVGFGGGESAFHLLEEGQDLEGELLIAIGAARDANQGEARAYLPREGVPDYKNRHRM